MTFRFMKLVYEEHIMTILCAELCFPRVSYMQSSRRHVTPSKEKAF